MYAFIRLCVFAVFWFSIGPGSLASQLASQLEPETSERGAPHGCERPPHSRPSGPPPRPLRVRRGRGIQRAEPRRRHAVLGGLGERGALFALRARVRGHRSAIETPASSGRDR